MVSAERKRAEGERESCEEEPARLSLPGNGPTRQTIRLARFCHIGEPSASLFLSLSYPSLLSALALHRDTQPRPRAHEHRAREREPSETRRLQHVVLAQSYTYHLSIREPPVSRSYRMRSRIALPLYAFSLLAPRQAPVFPSLSDHRSLQVG